jgi:acyl-CoA synthetase (AMP-forming)/AMP-acid ligase II
MFVTWTAGACLCPSQQAALLAPAKFIRERNLTVWFSVPSVAMMMRRSRTLRPEILPSLRLSLFCGEPLPDSIAAGWAEAAPGSKIVNLYGPTEATIAVAAYEWQPSSPEQAQGIAPIGWVFPSQEAVLIDEHRRLQTGAGVGELCLSGSQVTRGYLNQPDKTAEQFVRLTGGGERIWYRTGDLVERGADGCMFFRGRIDNQVKINGYRIELQEIEKVLRSESGADVAIAVTLPPPPAAPERVVGCVAGLKGAVDEVALREACSRKLPDYMVPQRIIEVETLPLNVNGKVDRKALTEIAAGVD